MAGDWRDQLKKLQQRKELLVIVLFLFVIIIFWITISLIASQQTVGIPTEQQRLARPLNPSLDVVVIEELELKRSYDDFELGDFQILILPGLESVIESQALPSESEQVEPASSPESSEQIEEPIPSASETDEEPPSAEF